MFGTRIGVTADGKFFIDSMPLEKKKRENKGASILARLSDFTALKRLDYHRNMIQ